MPPKKKGGKPKKTADWSDNDEKFDLKIPAGDESDDMIAPTNAFSMLMMANNGEGDESSESEAAAPVKSSNRKKKPTPATVGAFALAEDLDDASDGFDDQSETKKKKKKSIIDDDGEEVKKDKKKKKKKAEEASDEEAAKKDKKKKKKKKEGDEVSDEETEKKDKKKKKKKKDKEAESEDSSEKKDKKKKKKKKVQESEEEEDQEEIQDDATSPVTESAPVPAAKLKAPQPEPEPEPEPATPETPSEPVAQPQKRKKNMKGTGNRNAAVATTSDQTSPADTPQISEPSSSASSPKFGKKSFTIPPTTASTSASAANPNAPTRVRDFQEEDTSVIVGLSKISLKGSSAVPTELLDLRFRKPDDADMSNVAVTGALLSDRNSKDVQVDKFSLQAYGQLLIKDTSLNLLYGRKYGLLGPNGCGKSVLLQCLGWGEVPLPRLVDVFLLDKEFDATDMTAIEAVLDIVGKEREKLEDEMETLLDKPGGNQDPKLEYIMERLSELEMQGSEHRAEEILAGLGFDVDMRRMKTREFSGGWRMRIALSRALFVRPTLLLLDDPTNHLDLGACVWLEEYLKAYEHTILMVSHSQDFLNGICSDMIHHHNKNLDYYSGGYDDFVKARAERDQHLAKRHKAEVKEKDRLKDQAGKGSTGAKIAKSKEKALVKKLERTGGPAEDEMVYQKDLVIRFNDCGRGLPPPCIGFRDVSFAYPKKTLLFEDLNFGVDLDSRIALVGPNGAGKSTIMKLMVGELMSVEGEITRRHGLKIARFHQHLTEQLNLQVSAVEWIISEFPASAYKEHDSRLILGRFGLTGKSQVAPMFQLSDGQKRRVIFAWLALSNPHILMLDEPSNFLGAFWL